MVRETIQGSDTSRKYSRITVAAIETLTDTERLSSVLEIPVRLGNDVHVATQAEYILGCARGYASVLGVFWGTGVGGSLILDGHQWEGRGTAGEIKLNDAIVALNALAKDPTAKVPACRAAD